MDKKHLRGSQKLIVSALGVAIVVPLVAAPASAALDGRDQFQIRAVDTKHSTIVGTKGLKGLTGSTTSPGGTTPVVDDPALSVAAKCGPLSYTITPTMTSLSAANIKAAADGRTGDIKNSSDGWKSIWHYDQTAGSISAGAGSPTASFKLIYLGDSTTAPELMKLAVGVPDNTKLRIYTSDPDNYCSITDLRGSKTAGSTFSYLKSGSDYTEGRYETVGGTTLYTTVSGPRSVGGGSQYQQFSRGLGPVTTSTATILKSTSNLYSGTVYADGTREGTMILPSAVDGSDYVTFTLNKDGSGGVSYTKLVDNGNVIAVRKNAPVSISFDSTGKITQLGYNDPANTDNLKYLSGSSATVANYNSVTGQNWDGKYDNGKSYDYTMPFQPKAPTS